MSLVKSQGELDKKPDPIMSKPPWSKEPPPGLHPKKQHLCNKQTGCSPRSLDPVSTSLPWCEQPLRNPTGLQTETHI